MAFTGDRRSFAHWNNAVWVSDRELIEALGAGVRGNPYEKFRDVDRFRAAGPRIPSRPSTRETREPVLLGVFRLPFLPAGVR